MKAVSLLDMAGLRETTLGPDRHDEKREEKEQDEADQDEIALGGVEVREDDLPRQPSHNPTDGEIEASHEAGETRPQAEQSTPGMEPKAGNDQPAEAKSQQGTRDDADSLGLELASPRDDEPHPEDAVEGLSPGEQEAQTEDTKKEFRHGDTV